MSSHSQIKRNTISIFAKYKKDKFKFNVITAYDSALASIFDQSGVPIILVGDSAGNNFLGYENTIPVTLEQMAMLTSAVVRGSEKALIIADLPFGSYQISPEQAVESSIYLTKEGGAQGVKLEGGREVVPQIEKIIASGIPVVGHLGLTPQSVNAIGGYKIQGKGADADRVLADSVALEKAGISALVLELVPAELANKISQTLTIPTIGIGAGNGTDGQVLVWTDLLGINTNTPKFVRQYLDLDKLIPASIEKWLQDTQSGNFPGVEESY